jgi:hypothetical protein
VVCTADPKDPSDLPNLALRRLFDKYPLGVETNNKR